MEKRDQGSGIPTAEEIQKEEQELEAMALAGDRETEEDDDEELDSKKNKDDEDDEGADDDEEDDSEEEDDDDIEDEEDDDDEDEDDEEDEDDPKGKKSVPAWKLKMAERRFNQALEKKTDEIRTEFEEKYGRAPTKKEEKEINADGIEEFLKEFGIEDDKSKEFIKGLQKVMGAPTLPKEFIDRMSLIEKQQQEKLEELGFEKDFGSQKKLIAKLFPDADDKATARIKDKVKELAYTEKYAKYSLEDIIRLNRKKLAPVERKKTGEPSKGGTGAARYSAKDIDPEKIDWDSLSVEEAEKVMAELEKKGGNKASRLKIYRKGKRVN